MREEKALYDNLLAQRHASLRAQLQGEDEANAEVYLDGASNILSKPEFAGAEGMRELFRTFEAKSRLVKILNECVDGKPSVGSVRCDNWQREPRLLDETLLGDHDLISGRRRCSGTWEW